MYINEFINGLYELESKGYVTNIKNLSNHIQFEVDKRCEGNIVLVCSMCEEYKLITPYKSNQYYLINTDDLDNALNQKNYRLVAHELDKLSFIRACHAFSNRILFKVL